MCEISSEKLIKAVKARPALYNRDDARYQKHNKYKSKKWKEVCKEVFTNWDNLKPSQKLEYDLELQRRWKSLRTCFSRELLLQKKEQIRKAGPEHDDDHNGPYKRRKKYEHFDALSFLLNPESVCTETEAKPNDSNDEESEDDSSDPLENEIKIENLIYHTDTSKNSGNVPQILPVEIENNEEQLHSFYERPQESRIVEAKILDLLKEKKKEEQDEDRQFMLSLVPGFKKFNERQKYEAKIEILKVLMNVTFQEKRQDNNDV